MQAFTDFILQVTYPPNPIRALDNSLTADQQAGRDFFFESQPVGRASRPATAATSSTRRTGFFGTRRLLELRVRDRSSSRSRTCATCTRRSACSACRPIAVRQPGRQRLQGRPGARLRLPARRQRRHRLPLPPRAPSSTRRTPAASRSRTTPAASRRRRGRRAAPPGRGLHARLRHQPGPDRRPAGDARRHGSSTGQLLAGKKLLIKDSPSDDEARRTIVVAIEGRAITRSRARQRGRSALRRRPAGHGQGAHHGGQRDVRTSRTRSHLVCDNWSALGSTSAPTGYDYRDPELEQRHGQDPSSGRTGKLLKAVFKRQGPDGAHLRPAGRRPVRASSTSS